MASPGGPYLATDVTSSAAQCAVFSANWHKGDALISGTALEAHGNPIGCRAAESAG